MSMVVSYVCFEWTDALCVSWYAMSSQLTGVLCVSCYAMCALSGLVDYV